MSITSSSYGSNMSPPKSIAPNIRAPLEITTIIRFEGSGLPLEASLSISSHASSHVSSCSHDLAYGTLTSNGDSMKTAQSQGTGLVRGEGRGYDNGRGTGKGTRHDEGTDKDKRRHSQMQAARFRKTAA